MRPYKHCLKPVLYIGSVILILASLASVSPINVFSQDKTRTKPAESTAAVWDLENLSKSALSSDTITALTQHIRVKVFNILPDYRWIERGRIKEVLEEQKFQASGCTDQSCAVEMGQLLGARKMVTGSLSKTGNTYNLTLSVIDIETGLIDKSASEICPDCNEGQLYQLAEKTVLAMSGKPYPQLEPGKPPPLLKTKKSKSSAVYEIPHSTPTTGGDWLFVPGDTLLGTTDFYVMKYEAKNVGGVSTSQANATPWVNITHPEAVAACAALGADFHLLTTGEAQTINRNIEARAANWADGKIGSLVSAGGGLKRGNVGINDSASYAGATPEFGVGRNAKAKLVFSSGGEIWDWAGNVWEFIYGAGSDGTQGSPGGVTFNTDGWHEWNSANDPDLSLERKIIGPSNGGWSGNNGVGRYLGGPTTNVVAHGGSWVSGAAAGVFSFLAIGAPSGSAATIGFRCSR